MRSLLRVSRFLGPYRWRVVAALVCLILTNATNLFFPQFFRLIIDAGITPHNGSVILYATIGLVIGSIVRGVMVFLQRFVAESVSQDVAFDLRNVIYDRLQLLSFSYHDQAQTSQLLTRVTSDVEAIQRFTGTGVIQLGSIFLTMLGTAIILLLTNFRLGVVSLIIVPVIFVIIARFLRDVPRQAADAQAKLGALDVILEENLAGERVVKAFVREELETERYEAANRRVQNSNLDMVRSLSLRTPLIIFIGNLGTLLVIWVGGHDVIDHALSFGELVAFMTYLNFLITPLLNLGTIAADVSRTIASSERVFEILDAAIDVKDSPEAQDLQKVDGDIEFRAVSMRYAGSENFAARDVSFRVHPGQTVALVGEAGSGKSTIAHLIPRFYDPTSGAVYVDGRDIRSITLQSLRRNIGVVLQDTTLFRGTIRENIAFGRPDATDDEIIAATRAAQAHDFVLAQPNGYDTRLGEGGSGLSGGQRQRLSIARALLLNPKILILDDSTSSVDVETEYQIQLALDRLIEGRTTVIIAQKLSSVRRADLIVVVENAQVLAQGTHDELLDICPTYVEIIASQLIRDERGQEVGTSRA